ncbi:MAG: lysozyme [Hydrogenophaga sp.]|nr:lysozyme [Hydrogenophaga sp.]
MKTSENCINLIKVFEGFSSKPYMCPAGVPTIGYGSTRYADNKPVKLADELITEPEAVAILYKTLTTYEDAVNRYVSRPINQNQFDALVDFAYNVGAQNLRTSRLLKKLNGGDINGASKEFTKWVYAGGNILNGLVKRRLAEQALFNKA